MICIIADIRISYIVHPHYIAEINENKNYCHKADNLIVYKNLANFIYGFNIIISTFFDFAYLMVFIVPPGRPSVTAIMSVEWSTMYSLRF